MSGTTITISGSYNDSRLVLSSQGASITDTITDRVEVELSDSPHLTYKLDATMDDIPNDGVLDKLLIFRNNPLNIENKSLIKKQGTLGSILVIGDGSNNFTDFNNVPGLETIEPANAKINHKMKNVTLIGLGDNDNDINALTLVNLDKNNTFENIHVINSQDDGIEIFGGTVDMSNITIQDAKDDYFDTDTGHSGTITNLNLIQIDPSNGMSLIECGGASATTTKFVNVKYKDPRSVDGYTNNSSDKNFNIKNGSTVMINDVSLSDATDTLPHLTYKLDATMDDIPNDGVLDKLLIFRNNPLNIENKSLIKKQGTLGSILVIGDGSNNFTDFNNVPGLETIEPANAKINHKMKNVTLIGLGDNDNDINALTLVNLDKNNTFENIHVINSQDDGIEIFGGTVDMSNITIQDAKDDYFDTDTGHSGTITNLNLIQIDPSNGMSLIECGGASATTTKFVNVKYKDPRSVDGYTNNSSDKNFNIKNGSTVMINNVSLSDATDTLP